MEKIDNLKKQRVAKRIANLGVCSRRDAEKLILEKRIGVNGVIITTPAFLVSESDVIMLDKKVIKGGQETRLFMYYKPRGFICSYKDNEDRQTIFDDLKRYEGLPRLIYVGRLDYNSEGLLLLTNSGDLSNMLTDSNLELKRVYKVRAFGKITQGELDSLALGIEIDSIRYKSVIANILSQKGSNMWIEFVLKEGKNKEIRKICEHFGLTVSRLIRINFGSYDLSDLAEGDLVELEISSLKGILGDKLYAGLRKEL